MVKIRMLSFRRKSKTLVDQGQEQAPLPQTNAEQGRVKYSIPHLGGEKPCVIIHKDLELLLKNTIEIPLTTIVRTVSAEIVKPLTKALNEAWGKEAGDFLGPLATVVVHPRELLATINIDDMTESVSGVLKALIQKLADEILVPFLEVLRVVLETLAGGKHVFVLTGIENLVRGIVPAILKAIFGDQPETETAVWVASITDDLLKALQGPLKRPAGLWKLSKNTPANSGGIILVSAETQPNIAATLQMPVVNKLLVPVEESLADSLKETLDDFKIQVEQALS